MENERLSIEHGLDTVQTNAQVDKVAQNSHDHASQKLSAAVSQKPADVSPEQVRQDAAVDAMLLDPEECTPSTPRQANEWTVYNSPVSSPTEVISSSELPFLQKLDEIED